MEAAARSSVRSALAEVQPLVRSALAEVQPLVEVGPLVTMSREAWTG